jgi:hypothetical protein
MAQARASSCVTAARPAPRRAALCLSLVAALALCGCGSGAREAPTDDAPDAAATAAGSETPAATAAPPPPAPLRARAGRSVGIWVDAATVRHGATTGAAWQQLLADAQADPGEADIADQDSGHDVATLAAALVCARTATPELCEKARTGLLSAMGTERSGRWLAVGRNLTAYVIAADVLGLRADGDAASAGSRVEAWIRGFLTARLEHNNSGEPIGFMPFASGSNASAQQGAAYAAVAAYLRDPAALRRAWDAFRTYVCDPSAPDHGRIDLRRGVEAGWAHDDRRPCAVNPAGATKEIPEGRPGAEQLRPISGAIINDMARGGDVAWPPGTTHYPWVALEGLVPAAVILHRAGYPAFAVADRAVLRAVRYLWNLKRSTMSGRWFQERRSNEILQLVNVAYGTRFPVELPTGAGRTVGYTDWTHATRVDETAG